MTIFLLFCLTLIASENTAAFGTTSLNFRPIAPILTQRTATSSKRRNLTILASLREDQKHSSNDSSSNPSSSSTTPPKPAKPTGYISKTASSKTPAEAFGKPLSDTTKTFNRAAISFVKNSLFDAFFSGPNRDYARFYALETIARMPYFSYLSVLHLYETLGWWRRANYLKVHFAESWNEMHHLLIMEELGGNDLWFDRFVAQHVAFFYYWFAVTVYMVNPILAYNLNQAVEEHAYETYDTFIKENGDKLELLPAPRIAKEYYRDGDLYLLDEMHTDKSRAGPRRPKCDTLLDVFIAIRDDEMEHVKTMEYLQRVDSEGIDSDSKEDEDCDTSVLRSGEWE